MIFDGPSPQKPRKKGPGIVAIFFSILIGIAILGALSGPKQPDPPTAPAAKLDYSKQAYTTCCTIACPDSLLFAVDQNHSPEKIVEMFTSVWNRSDKAKELGCIELREGLPVYASQFEDGLANIGFSKSDQAAYFTLETELTNAVPGQSAAQAAELAAPDVNRPPAVQAATPTPEFAPTGPTRLMLQMPYRGIIPVGDVVANRDSIGEGAYICPDENTFAALLDSSAKPPSAQSDNSRMTGGLDSQLLKRFGCSYFPPGTPMYSKGRGNDAGSLALVSVTLPDGSQLQGVTFPSSIVQSQRKSEQATPAAGPDPTLPAQVTKPVQGQS